MTCFRISQDFSSLLVDSYEPDGVDEGKEDGGEADGALLAVDVDHAGVAFRCAVKLTDALDAESFRELQRNKNKILNLWNAKNFKPSLKRRSP